MATLVVDIGLGNLRSVQKALEVAAGAAGAATKVERSCDPDAVRRAERVVFPGQGAFRDASRALSNGLGQAIVERISAGVPYLGICLGLQVLLEGSDEAPGEPGLGVFTGRVERLQGAPELKIPHMGWNQLELLGGGHPMLEAAGGSGSWVYFVHSYHAVPRELVLRAVCDYGPNRVTSAIGRDNLLATQFHPEKSQRAGLALLEAFFRS